MENNATHLSVVGMDNNTLLVKVLTLVVVVIGLWFLNKHLERAYQPDKGVAKLEAWKKEHLEGPFHRVQPDAIGCEFQMDYLKEQLRGKGIDVR
jgi:hypothetical protein